jgi:hypothetical protein
VIDIPDRDLQIQNKPPQLTYFETTNQKSDIYKMFIEGLVGEASDMKSLISKINNLPSSADKIFFRQFIKVFEAMKIRINENKSSFSAYEILS